MAPGGDHCGGGLGPLERKALVAIRARTRTTREIADLLQRSIGQARSLCAALHRRGLIDQPRWGDPWALARCLAETAPDEARAP